VRPRIALAGSILRANVRAYAALGRPVAAVVKNDGYGWGAPRVAREIDELIESYVVADAAEFWALRMHTRRPIRLLASAAAGIGAICANGGIPNVTTSAALDAVGALAAETKRPLTIRVGIVDVAGWAGISPQDAAAFAARCARYDLCVELWTHLTTAERSDAVNAAFDAAVAGFVGAGVKVVGCDRASTAWVASARHDVRVRVGAGLFGARLGGDVATTCAIRVDAPVVERFAPGVVRWAGYGDIPVPAHRGVAILRCGYGDGLPKKLEGHDDILSIGMQYTTRLSDSAATEHALIDENSDLDELARRVGLSPHELIVGLAQET
jgi:alanine racemase